MTILILLYYITCSCSTLKSVELISAKRPAARTDVEALWCISQQQTSYMSSG